MQLLFALLALLANAAWKVGLIQENIFRNRKLGEDPQSRKWHWWQGFQYVAVVAIVFFAGSYFSGHWCWAVLLVEWPLTMAFWFFFQGFNNTQTFGREWWYVGIVGDDKHGSAIDRWFLRRKNPKRAMQVAQASGFALSILVLVIYYL